MTKEGNVAKEAYRDDPIDWLVTPNGRSAGDAVLWIIEDGQGNSVEPGIGYTEREGAEERLEELRHSHH